MRSFLKSRMLWHYCTGAMTIPVKGASEEDTVFLSRMIEWDSHNHMILTWIRNTSIPSISNLLGSFDDAKSAWDMLTKRYSTTHGSMKYQLVVELHQLRQEPGQSINDYYDQLRFIWDQIDISNPTWGCSKDAQQYASIRDEFRLYEFLMSLHKDFEPIRGQLLNRSPAPSLDTAVNELVRKEARLATLQAQNKLNILAITPSTPLIEQPQQLGDFSGSSNRRKQTNKKFCNYCKRPGHTIETCYRRNKSTIAVANTAPTPPTVSTSQSSGSTINLSSTELQEIIAQAIRMVGNTSLSTALSVLPGKSQTWLFDSACCNHMTPHSSLFTNLDPAPHPLNIHIADGSTMHGNSLGFVSTSTLSVPGVFHVPDLSYNLCSVGQLAELGYRLIFYYSGCIVQDPRTGQELGTGPRVGRMFPVNNLHLPPVAPVSVAAATAAVSSLPSRALWHSRLGHAPSSRVQQLVSRGLLGSVSKYNFDCTSCQLGKQPALPFNNSDSISKSIFELIHSDVWGPSPVASIDGSRYFVVFIDDYSRYSWIFPMKSRSEILSIYSNFAKMVETQFSKRIKTFRSDNALEYTQHAFQALLHSYGTIHHLTCPGTSQQNGRAERKLRHILDTVRALLLSAKIPAPFWGEASLHAVHAINRIPSTVIHNQTPYERLFGSPPNYHHLRSFGSACFVLLQPHEHNKLEPRSRLCCFLGYGETQKGYRCYDLVSHRLRVSQIFPDESLVPSANTFDLHLDFSPNIFDASPRQVADEQIIHELPHFEPGSPAPTLPEDPPQDIPPRHSTRVRSIPPHLLDYHCYTALATLHEPQTYREASTDPLWQIAMKEELDALTKNHTWDLVTLPPGQSVVGCKWIYKIKTRSDGSVERYKARLVGKGFTQEYGIDYEETFAPVARISSVRALLAVAAARKWDLFQMDVKNAFLNGDLSEEVYMQPPPGLSIESNKVCHLRRALYGLKQAPRAWFAKFSSTIFRLGYTSSPYDSALFLRRTDKGTILLLLYVDDMIITGDDLSGIQELKDFLSQQFEMKDLGHLSYFLGLEITHSTDGLYITQANLVYLTVTRPDISYAVHQDTLFHGLFYSAQSPLVLRAFSDADWAGDLTDRRSTTGYCFLLGSSLISWRSKKQTFVARSSTEAEYRALADTTSELLWLRWLLKDLGVSTSSATPLYCDNQSAIHIAHNDVFHERTKHIEIDCHFIRYHLLHGALKLFSVSSKDQLVDIFTKSLPKRRTRDLVDNLKLVSHPP
ncbi:Retrovirus-related Pol polyprotein from transposon TNT 1-94 [Vitis vinifera]|uniref:Retrovirus-related Pol polyprotein from transposon TNT 1-94 n=1 Tax=Vitis vinifera TaxID=29760 RepID=A0A438ENE2_VITVI|nr:Retrovirus-related Pol polyprotein from transposon TNT 1-94 [Vitis vinifera]